MRGGAIISVTQQGLGGRWLWIQTSPVRWQVCEAFQGVLQGYLLLLNTTSYFSFLSAPVAAKAFPAVPSHTSCCSLSGNKVPVPARSCVSELLTGRCLCRPVSLITAGCWLNKNCKGIFMLTAAASVSWLYLELPVSYCLQHCQRAGMVKIKTNLFLLFILFIILLTLYIFYFLLFILLFIQDGFS